MVQIEFDPDKNAINADKHGVSLARAAELTAVIVVRDLRYAEERFRLYGMIDGVPHCAAVTLRNEVVRVISLRRAHQKEYRRYAPNY